jgi:BlaI family transcriptional regulator, penicillinase repressor
MVRKGRDVTDAEMAVMQELWEDGPATIRQLTERLYSDVESQYATVKKLLERLEAKNCVTRDRSEMVHVFTAAVDREELIDRRLREVADTLCEGSIAPLLSHAAKHEGLTRAQRELLHGLVDELESRSRKERKRT